MSENKCRVCGSSFPAKHKKVPACSPECKEVFDSWPRWTEAICGWCKKPFQQDKHNLMKSCSVECRNASRAKSRNKTCLSCGAQFKADRAEQKYCSRKCFGVGTSGRGSKGGLVPLCICGNPILNKARVYCSDECLVKNRKSKQGKPDVTHTCQKCGQEFSRPWYYAGKKKFCSPKCGLSGIVKESQGQLEVKDLISSLGIETQSGRLPSGREIDVYCPEHKIGFEYNGAYWHSMAGLERRGVTQKIRYHLSKTKEAEANGQFIYHVWSWEWEDPRTRPIVESQIRNLLGKTSRRVFARKTVLTEVDNITAGRFLQENHLFGRVNAQIHYGLMADQELVAMMSFSQKDEVWTLSRFCLAKDTSVVGGASKLFQHFIKTCHPKKVVSYSDQSKTTGGMYSQLGFKLSHETDPEYVNVDFNKNKVYRRYQTMRKALLAKHPQLSPDMTERQMCDALGYVRVYGCGRKVWVWVDSFTTTL